MALRLHADVEIAGEARHADEARMLVDTLRPDLIFLDIQMPEKTGFDLLEMLNDVPEVIFLTAYHDHAVQAFDVNALDYILKPFREERLAQALNKVRDKLATGATASDRRIFIKDNARCYFIKASEIYLIESLENYSRLYFGKHKVLIKRSLNQWEKQLDAAHFFRVSRTKIINLSHVAEVKTASNGRLRLLLTSGLETEVSSRQTVKFKKLNHL
jgi:two-component system LytT family response regulator